MSCARIFTLTMSAHRWPKGADVFQCPLSVCAARMGALGARRIARQTHDRSILRGQAAANHESGRARLVANDTAYGSSPDPDTPTPRVRQCAINAALRDPELRSHAYSAPARQAAAQEPLLRRSEAARTRR